jgi:hypothetical protein
MNISLSQIRVAKPCPMSWAEMEGDDRIRFCRQCNLNVYNLSSLSREEAERLVNEKEGRLCVTYYQRVDGTIITQDCPVGVRLARRAFRSVAVVAAAICFVLVHLASAIGRADARTALHDIQPFKWVQSKLGKRPTVSFGRPCTGMVGGPGSGS